MRLGIALLVGALCVSTPAHGQSILGSLTKGVSDNADQVSRIATKGLKKFSCALAPAAVKQIEYSDADSFDCSLRNALSKEPSAELVVNLPAGKSADFPTSEAKLNTLKALLPDRLALWAAAVEDRGGQVEVCIANRAESWAFVIGLGLSLVEKLFFDPAREEEKFFKIAEKYHVAVIFDAHQGKKSVTLAQVSFSPRSAGPIIHPDCGWRGLESGEEKGNAVGASSQTPATPG